MDTLTSRSILSKSPSTPTNQKATLLNFAATPDLMELDTWATLLMLYTELTTTVAKPPCPTIRPGPVQDITSRRRAISNTMS